MFKDFISSGRMDESRGIHGTLRESTPNDKLPESYAVINKLGGIHGMFKDSTPKDKLHGLDTITASSGDFLGACIGVQGAV